MKMSRCSDRATGNRRVRALAAILGVGASCAGAQAQFETGFEVPEYNASAAGTVLTAQQGWYLPTGTSTDWSAYTYLGNALGLPPNPQGDDQFAAATGQGAGTNARAQMDVTLGAGTWTLATDVSISLFQGTLPAVINIGSLSTQPGGASARLIMLARWVDINTVNAWNADILYYNAAGTAITATVPDPGFQNLQINHWYRWSATFDFDSNRIGELKIEDLTTGATATHNPSDWYLQGGAAGTLPLPTAIRMFAGGSTAAFGNTLAFDNVSITSGAACPCACDFDPDPACDIFDFLTFQNLFVGGDPCACEMDPDPACDIFDFLAFQNEFVRGCP